MPSASMSVKARLIRRLVGVAGGLAIATPVAAQDAPVRACTPVMPDSVTAFTNATLIDGTGAEPRAGVTVLVQGERVSAVFPTGSRSLPAGATLVDLNGDFMIPGLIDSYAHVATDPRDQDERSVTEMRLCSALLGGVTTIRDMAGDVRALGSLARDASVGAIVSPDIVYVALFAGPGFFSDPRTESSAAGATPGELPWMRSVTDTSSLSQMVAEARGTGAGALKLYAQLSAPLVRAIVAEGRRQQLPVWSHLLIGPAGPLEVVEAGVDVVSHAPHLAAAMGMDRYRALIADSSEVEIPIGDPSIDSLYSTMARRGTILDATLFIFKSRPRVLEVSGALLGQAHEWGVSIVAGTDSLGVPDPEVLPNLHTELELLVDEAGLSPRDALNAATSTAALAAGVAESRGTVEVGKLADLVVLTSDPLQDISNTRSIRLVVKRGRVYQRR